MSRCIERIGDLGAAAAVYVERGWSVFPLWWTADGVCACPAAADCASPGKHPLIPGGVHGAIRAVDGVRRWWDRWPLANVGLPAGDNGLAVLDVDPHHGGYVSLGRLVEALSMRGLDLPPTLAAMTGSGGWHFVYAAPEDGIKSAPRAFGLSGLDTRGRGGYIVAAPSVHACGEIGRAHV